MKTLKALVPVTPLVILGLLVAACASEPSPPLRPIDDSAGAAFSERSRVLIIQVRSEPNTYAVRPVLAGGFSGNRPAADLFNADLTYVDHQGRIRPRLAETLPELNSATWRVFPDGQMETTWRLRPNVVWHDGTPLTTDDWVFAWRVYSQPEYGAAGSRLIRSIDDMQTPDERTLVIRYSVPFPDAGEISGPEGLPPLPRHILEQPLTHLDANSFANLPFWTREYVGLGPYRPVRLEPGSYFEAEAFDWYILGKPKISRIRVHIVLDANAALAQWLSGQAHLMAGGNPIGLEQAIALKNEWARTGAGTVFPIGGLWRATAFQMRRDYARPSYIQQDVRIRRALAHAVDKQTLGDVVWHGLMAYSDFFIPPGSKWSPVLETSVVKYPYNARRSEELMADAGWTKAADGFYAHPDHGRFKAELKTVDGTEWVAEMTIMANTWRKLGFDIQDAVLPAAAANDPEARTTFPSMFTSQIGQGERALDTFTTAAIPRAEHKFRNGTNRGGYSNPEYDRLNDLFNKTLDPTSRGHLVAEMARTFTVDLPLIPLFHITQTGARVKGLTGTLETTPGDGNFYANVHEWEFR